MLLAEWMNRQRVDDEELAAMLSQAGVPRDRTGVSRYRRGLRRPDWPALEAIRRITRGKVTADDFQGCVNARQP